MADGEEGELEREFQYSSSGSEYEDCEEVPQASLYSVFKGFHVAGKYREAMNSQPAEAKEKEHAEAPAVASVGTEDAPGSIDTVDFGSAEKAVDDTKGPGVRDRIKMFESGGNLSNSAQKLQSEKKGPNYDGENDSLSNLLGDYSIIGHSVFKKTTDDVSNQSPKENPQLPPKPVVRSDSPSSKDSFDQYGHPKGEYKHDFTKSVFADTAEEVFEVFVNEDSTETDLDAVCSDAGQSRDTKEQNTLQPNQSRADHQDEPVVRDIDENTPITETTQIENTTEPPIIENTDLNVETSSADQFTNDRSDNDSADDENEAIELAETENGPERGNESENMDDSKLAAETLTYSENVYEHSGEMQNVEELSEDTKQESADYENVAQEAEPVMSDDLYSSEHYDIKNDPEQTVDEVPFAKDQYASDDEPPTEGDQTFTDTTVADEAIDSIQVIAVDTLQRTEEFRSMSSSVGTGDLAWSFVEPHSDDRNEPESDSHSGTLDESSSSISVISSSLADSMTSSNSAQLHKESISYEDNRTMKTEDVLITTKDDSGTEIPHQQLAAEVSYVRIPITSDDRKEDLSLINTTEEERPPTPPPKSMVVQEELKSLAQTHEMEPTVMAYGAHTQSCSDNQQSEEASSRVTDELNRTNPSFAGQSQPMPNSQGTFQYMADMYTKRTPSFPEQQLGYAPPTPVSGYPGPFSFQQNQYPNPPSTGNYSNVGTFLPSQAPWRPPFIPYPGINPQIHEQFHGQNMPPPRYSSYPMPFFPASPGQGYQMPLHPSRPPFSPGPQNTQFGSPSPDTHAPTVNVDRAPSDAKPQPSVNTEHTQVRKSPMTTKVENLVERRPTVQTKIKSPPRPKSTGRDKSRLLHEDLPQKVVPAKQQRATPTHHRQTTSQHTEHLLAQKNVSKHPEAKPQIAERKTEASKKYSDMEAPERQVKPKVPEKSVLEDTSEHFMFVKVLNPPLPSEACQTSMQLYFEVCTDKEINANDIIINYQRACIVFSSKGKPDMDRVKQNISERKKMCNAALEMQLLDRPCSVAISCKSGLEVSESLELFVESPRNHGGELHGQMFETDDGSCIVATFKDPNVAESFSKKKDHVHYGKPLTVSSFFRCDWGDVWDPNLHKVVLPEPFSIELTNNRKTLLQRPTFESFIQDLERKFCRCEFTGKGLQIACTLQRTMTDLKTKKANWLGDVAAFVGNFMEHELEHYDLDCGTNIWNDMKTFCKRYAEKDKVVVYCNDTRRLIEIDSLRGCGQDVQAAILCHAKALERQLQRTSECMLLKELHIILMKKLGIFESMKETDIVVTLGKDTVTMEGQPEDITALQKNIYEAKNSIKNVQLNQCLSERCLRVINENQTLCDEIQKVLKNENIVAVWKVIGSSLQCAYMEDSQDHECSSVYEYEELETNNPIQKIFTSNITDKSINFLATDASVMNTDVFYTFSQDLTEENDTLAEWHIDEPHLKIHFFGWTPTVDKMLNEMQAFVDEHFIRQVVIQPGDLKFCYLKRHRRDVLTDMTTTLEAEKGSLKLIDDKSSVSVYGNRKSREDVKRKLETFFASIISDHLKIEKVGVNKVFEDVDVRGKITDIENQTGCLLQRRGKDIDVAIKSLPQTEDDHYERIPVDGEVGGAVSKPQPVKAEQHKELSLQNGTKIIVIEGEIGKQKGDIFVISTSPNLDLKGGKAGNAILQAAGQDLQREIKTTYTSDIKFGEIAHVSGGHMKCKKLYLTCLPGWDAKDHKPIDVLKTAVKSALELGSKQNMTSILFSALGCGQLKYPVHMVAHEMMQVVSDFDMAKTNASLKTVKFVVFQRDEKVKHAFMRELNNRLDGGTGGTATIPAQCLRKGTATIELVVEDIAAQTVDVIVCSTSSSMDLTKGACHALSKVGGDKLQEECKKKYNNSLKDGEIAEIGPGNLQCKALFLVVLPKYTGQESIENLKETIKRCVTLAQNRSFTSLAIPALGTGNLHYRKEDVARCMFDSLIELGTGEAEASPFNVRIIMHSKDSEVIEEFYKFMDVAKKRGVRGARNIGTMKKTDHSLGSDDASDYCTTKDGIRLHDTSLNVVIGDILDQSGDAVIASVGKGFDMHGGVANALNRMCPNLKDECQGQKNKLKEKGAVLMQAKELKAKRIIFVQYAESQNTWRQHITKCLKIAHKNKFATISFPVLGSGSGSQMLRPEVSAGCLFDALHDFMKIHNNSITVKEVRLIVYGGQKEMFEPIVEALDKKVTQMQEIGVFSYFKKVGRKFKQTAAEMLGLDDGTVPYQEREEILKRQHIHQHLDRKTQKALQSSLELVICSDSADNIEKCKAQLDKIIEDAMVTETISDYKEIIKALTRDESKGLDCDTMLVDFKIDPQAGIITIHGEIHHVHEAVTKLRQKLNEVMKEKGDLEQSQELAKKIKWYYEDSMEFVPYDTMLSFKMEMAYLKIEKTFHFMDDGKDYMIDFDELKEHPVNDKDDWVKVARKEIFKAENAALPEHWKPMLDDQNVKLVELPLHDPDFKRIEQRFFTELSTGQYANSPGHKYDKSKTKINKIQRIQNKALYRQYQTKRKQLEESNPNRPANMPLEQELWHGTNEQAMDSINLHGFNRSYAGNNAGKPWFGQGVYLARDASYSARSWMTGADSAGGKGYIFLVKALTGQYLKGNPDMRYLPPIDKKNPLVLYDCAVDNVNNPMEFVIFNDTQAYPEYLLTFTGA